MNNEQPLYDRAQADPATRSLQLFRSASFLCGIFENEIAGVAEWRKPTPLPQAPQSVLGVVSIQGRMLTVLNLAALLDNTSASSDSVHQNILALRGDEQLGLAVESLAETIEIGDAELDPAQEHRGNLILGNINYNGVEITILNVKELFPNAIQGRERRRRRF